MLTYGWIRVLSISLHLHTQDLSGLQSINNIWWGLNQLNQHPSPTNRSVLIYFGMDKSNIVTCSTLADSARSETNPILLHPIYCRGQIIDPETNVVERWFVYL